MHKLYSKLKPKERIQALIEFEVLPYLKCKGYRYIKSGIKLIKDIDDFTYEIWFPRNNRNIDDLVCAFEVHVSIYLKDYGKWYKKEYGKELNNNLLLSEHDDYIPNWNAHEFEYGYDLALADNNRILESLLININESVLPFLERVTNYDTAIEAVQRSNRYYLTPILMDLCEIMGNEKKSFELLTWFEKEVAAGTQFLTETFEEMELRKKRLKNGYKKSVP